jgi:hypothetical protein
MSAGQKRTSAAVWAACLSLLWIKAVKRCDIVGLASFIVLPTGRRTSVTRSAKPRDWMIAYLSLSKNEVIMEGEAPSWDCI